MSQLWPGSDGATAVVTRGRRLVVPWAGVLVVVLAFGLLGTRGLWEPDEGRYTNIALTMLDRDDWVDTMRNEDTAHWAKPPMTYWLIAASVSAFGRNAWAARLPAALAYLVCVALVYQCARRLVPGAQRTAALAFATMLLPVCAAQVITTDFPLTAAQLLAVHAFIEHRFGSGARRWLWLMGAAFALAFMTKGPPALMPLLPMLALRRLSPTPQPPQWAAGIGATALFVLLASPWFVIACLRHPGLMQYFLGAELVDRVASDRFGRNGEWYGWAAVYVPTLLVGTLPWTVDVLRWCRALPAQARRWRDRTARQCDERELFVALWLLLPLAVFCIARSRLPLYLLPCFAPLALIVAGQRRRSGRALPRAGWLAAWAVALLALRLAAAVVPMRQDSASWARAIAARTAGPVHEVVFVEDTPRYGLHLYLGAEVETLSLAVVPQPRFDPTYDEPLVRELMESGHKTGLVYVARQALWPRLSQQLRDAGYRAQPLGAPYRGRVIFRVEPLPAP